MSKIELLKRLYEDYSKKYLNKILISVFFTILLAGSTSSVAYLLDPAIKQLFIEQKQSYIYLIPAAIILAFFIKGTSLYIAKVIMIKVAEGVRKDIQCDMFNSIIYTDTDVMDKKHSGKYISNLNNDVGMITSLVSTTILNFFKDSLTLIGLLGVMIYQNWKLTLVAIIMIPLASLAAKSLGKRIRKATESQMRKAGILIKFMIETFKNHKLVKIFQREEYEKKRAYSVIDDFRKTNEKISIIFVRASPIMEILTGIMIAFLIFVSAKLIQNNELQVSNFFSFLAAMMLAYQPVRSLATLNIGIQQGLSGAGRVIKVIDEKQFIKDNLNDDDILIKDGEIKFDKVSFEYRGSETRVLNSVTLLIPGKKMTALVGHSGAGKSTILSLIPRLYNINEGDIKIDNQSIYSKKVYSLRKNISLVSQDTLLFDDTIKNNIAYANPNATDLEIINAAKFSFANEFIEKMPNGYDTVIGENGIRLSGGEKQRISIARAILKKTPIILLDEATSALDAETESKIQQAIIFLTKGKTTVVIAHRLSTILNSDKIFVIDKGEVVDGGNHDELIKSSKIYKNFYEKQLRKH